MGIQIMNKHKYFCFKTKLLMKLEWNETKKNIGSMNNRVFVLSDYMLINVDLQHTIARKKISWKQQEANQIRIFWASFPLLLCIV